MYRLLTAVVGVVAVALFALGCGSSGDNGETVEALTKAQFIKQADAACAKVAKKRDAVARSWQKEHADKLVAEELNEAFQAIVVPSVGEQIEALQALAPPKADSDDVARMIDNLVQANEDFEKEGSDGMDRPAVSQFEEQARKYGLKVCPRLT